MQECSNVHLVNAIIFLSAVHREVCKQVGIQYLDSQVGISYVLHVGNDRYGVATSSNETLEASQVSLPGSGGLAIICSPCLCFMSFYFFIFTHCCLLAHHLHW